MGRREGRRSRWIPMSEVWIQSSCFDLHEVGGIEDDAAGMVG